MTHDAGDRPKFYTMRQEAQWFFHNTVAHPVVGVLGLTAAFLHHTGGKTVPEFLLSVGEAIHEWSVPSDQPKPTVYEYDPLGDEAFED